MTLEEHHYRKPFSALIVGVGVLSETPSEKFYVMKLEGEPAEQLSRDYVVFYPDTLEFEKHFFKKALGSGGIRYRISMEEFVLNRDPTHVAVKGRLYEFPKRNSFDQMVLASRELVPLVRCRIT